MDNFKFSNASGLSKYLKVNEDGEKFGEAIITVSDLNQIESQDAKYVIFGIPTIHHTKSSFKVNSRNFEILLQKLLNTKNNQFNRANEVIVLGEIDMEPLQIELNEQNQNLESDRKKINEIHEKIDSIIYELATVIFDSGKVPIMLGGHINNSLSIGKAIKSSTKKSINLFDLSPNMNFDFSTKQEKQNSPNHFDKDLIRKYYAFGLHKNNIAQNNINFISASIQMDFKFYEDCLHLTTLDKCVKFKNSIDFLNGKFGFRLDLKSIQGLSANCESSSGFSLRDIRTFMKIVRKEKIEFLHICGLETCIEGMTSMVLSYLISDFMRHDD